MIDEKLKEIRDFCIKNSKQSNIDKYSRYFKDGFDGYGIDQKVYEAQKDFRIADWKIETAGVLKKPLLFIPDEAKRRSGIHK